MSEKEQILEMINSELDLLKHRLKGENQKRKENQDWFDKQDEEIDEQSNKYASEIAKLERFKKWLEALK